MSASNSPEGEMRLPLDKFRALMPLAAAAGIDLPELARFAPEIDATAPIRELALQLGGLVKRQNIFIQGAGGIVTVDEATGEIKPMKPARFCGWIEEFCSVKSGSRDRSSLSREAASLVLEQDIFQQCLRGLLSVHLVRLPVLRANGIVDLLAPGYDPESQIFTVETVSYPQGMELSEATDFLGGLLKEYPWPDLSAVRENRSVSVQIMSLVGVFCRAMFPPGTKRPMIVWIGNQAGTGKSTLAAMPLLAVFGEAASTDLSIGKEEVEKTLATKAITMAPYILFDDAPGGIFSNALNRFITASTHTGRVMGGNREEYRVPNVSQIFVTGNAIKLTSDLARRALIIELFLAKDARDRTFEKSITDTWLKRPEVRSKILAATWAIVRHWNENQRPAHDRPLESFEDWTGAIGGMVKLAGFADPLVTPDLPLGGDQEARELREVLIALADDVDDERDYSRQDIIDKARELGKIEDLVGGAGDPALTPGENKKFGKRLQFWRGRELMDSRGRRFTFGHRRISKGKLYPCTIIDAGLMVDSVAPSHGVAGSGDASADCAESLDID